MKNFKKNFKDLKLALTQAKSTLETTAAIKKCTHSLKTITSHTKLKLQ